MDFSSSSLLQLPGLFGDPYNFPWQVVSRWFDYWLKGIDNGVMSEPPVRCQLTDNFAVHMGFPAWPPIPSQETDYDLVARNSARFGALKPKNSTVLTAAVDATVAATGPDVPTTDTISFAKLTGLTAGIPIVGDVFQTFVHVPILTDISMTSVKHAIVYETDRLPSNVLLCGTPNLTLSTTANLPQYQIYGYLYSVDAVGLATLITVSPWTTWTGYPNPSASPSQLQFASVCLHLLKGRKIALGLDLSCSLFQAASPSKDLQVTIDASKSRLSLPFATPTSI